MKKTLLVCCAGIMAFISLYLLGAFYNVSFNISLWTNGSRLCVAIFSGIFIYAAIIVSGSYDK